MESTWEPGRVPDQTTGYSVVLAEQVAEWASTLKITDEWSTLPLGNTRKSKRAYQPQERILALIACLACGLRGIASANLWLRPNSALQAMLGGRFPDQGSIHRWLQQTTLDQAHSLRRHLHQVARRHGRFWSELSSPRGLTVDLDAQGLIATGQRFEKADLGYMDGEFKRGYQRLVCYVGATREVLDELLRPGSESLMGDLPLLLEGLNEIFSEHLRECVVLRGDGHAGTLANLAATREAGYHYLYKLSHPTTLRRMRAAVQDCAGVPFTDADDSGNPCQVTFWKLSDWELVNKDGPERRLKTPVVVYHEQLSDGTESWWALATDVVGSGPELRQWYRDRGGTIEEYYDQTERAYHLDLMRTGNFAGLAVFQVLVGLCWNLTCWATGELNLPPALAPQSDRTAWIPVRSMDLSAVMERARHCGLRLYRKSTAEPLEVEDTVVTPESTAWLRWLRQPIQHRLRLAG
jgi:hypothetical protein